MVIPTRTTDLINNVQLTLRTQAGLHSYDPTDPTLPAIPSLRQSVAALLPSPPDHRCRHCTATLLRGPHSAFCVYCSNTHLKDPSPPPLAFISTLASRCLLTSLHLDGSEIVEPSIDKQAPTRGQSTRKDKIPLSDLLNLEIPWLAEPDVTEHSLSKNASAQGKSIANMGAVDLDNLFTYAKDLVSDLGEEEAVINKQIGNVSFNAFAGQGNLVFAPKFPNPVMAATSSEAKENDDFSCWEADFMSADSGGQSEPSKSSDRFVSSTVDLSTHMDSVFGSGEPLENNEAKDVSISSVSTTSDWPQGDIWNKSNHVTEQVETAAEVKDHINGDNLTPPTSGWFPDDDQWQTHSNVATENKPTSGDDDSFDVWNNFPSSSNAQDPSKRSLGASQIDPSTGDDESPDVWDDFTSFPNADEPSKSSPTSIGIKSTTGDNDVWGNITSSSNAQDPSKSSFAVTEIKATTEHGDPSDVWDGFISSSNAHDPFKSSVTTTNSKLTTRDDDSSDVLDDFRSSSNAHDSFKSSITVTGTKPDTVDDDLSDVWDGLVGSNAHDPFKSSVTTTDNKSTTGVVDSHGFASSSDAHDPFKSSLITTGSELTTGVDDLSDVWDDFTSSSNAHDPVKSSITSTDKKPISGVDYSSEVWDFTSSSNAHDPFSGSITSPNNNPVNTLDDSSDFWDDFTSSSHVQNLSNSYNTQSVTEIAVFGGQPIDTTFPSSFDNFQKTDFGCFSQSDVFSEVVSRNNHVELRERQSEVSPSNRMVGEAAGDAKMVSNSGDGSNSAAKSEDAIESLFSQMHDLSFMLKTELSIPSMKDNPTSSQDLRPGS